MSELEKLERMWTSEPPENVSLSLNQLLDRWVSERFSDPESAMKALRKGERLKEASACLFWYCYRSLDGPGGKAPLILKKLRNEDKKAAETLIKNLGKISSQLDEMPGKFHLEDIEYATGHDPYVEVLVGSGLIILLSKKRSLHKDTRKLINRMNDSIADISVGEDGHELSIGMQPLEVDDNTYALSGDVPKFLAMLACVIIWDSFNYLATRTKRTKEYQEYFVTAAKIVDFCGSTLADSLDSLDNFEWDDISIHLPYSGVRSLDMNYFNKILSQWDDVEKELHKPEDWRGMLSTLEKIYTIFKYRYHPNKDKSGVIVEMLEPEVEEIENTINCKITLCKFEIERPGTTEHIFRARENTREEIIRKYFFSKGLDRQFESGTFKLVMEAEKAWQGKAFDTMTDKMRQALEIELIAAFPFLQFTKGRKDSRLIATRIKEAINNEEGIRDKIDSLQSITKQAKTQLKKQLPGFIGKVVDARNFFMKEAPYSKRDELKKYNIIAGNIHKEFFGIDCKGVFPFLMRCKQDIKTGT